jgi:hypothetical protein
MIQIFGPTNVPTDIKTKNMKSIELSLVLKSESLNMGFKNVKYIKIGAITNP